MWSHQHIAYLKSLRMVEVGSFLPPAHLAPQLAPAVPASYLGISMEHPLLQDIRNWRLRGFVALSQGWQRPGDPDCLMCQPRIVPSQALHRFYGSSVSGGDEDGAPNALPGLYRVFTIHTPEHAHSPMCVAA